MESTAPSSAASAAASSASASARPTRSSTDMVRVEACPEAVEVPPRRLRLRGEPREKPGLAGPLEPLVALAAPPPARGARLGELRGDLSPSAPLRGDFSPPSAAGGGLFAPKAAAPAVARSGLGVKTGVAARETGAMLGLPPAPAPLPPCCTSLPPRPLLAAVAARGALFAPCSGIVCRRLRHSATAPAHNTKPAMPPAK